MTILELDLLDRAVKGDDEAFQEIVEAYQNPVFHLCYRMLGNMEDAEDAAQESFWKAYQAIKKYDKVRSFATWILSITAHHCIDRLRKRRLPSFSIELLPEEAAPDFSPTPEDIVTRSEVDQLVRNLVIELKPEDRAVIILRYWYDMSEQEIASTLSMSISALKSRLHRARKYLARAYSGMQSPYSRAGEIQHEPSTL